MRRWRDPVAHAVREGGGLLPALPLWAWWLTDEAGFDRLTWLPATVVLALVVVVLHRWVPRPPLAGARAWAFGSLVALAAWSACSVAWAADQGAAWTGAQRVGLIALATGLVLVWPPTRRVLGGALVAYAGAVVVAGLVALLRVPGDLSLLVDGRLEPPAGYVNATAALFVMCALVLLTLASAVRVPAGRRRRGRTRAMVLGGASLGASAVLAGLALLTQSRGGVIAAAGAFVLAVAALPARRHIVLAGAVVVAVVAVLRDPLLDLRLHALEGTGADGAWRALAGLGAIGLLVGVAGALLTLVPEARARAARQVAIPRRVLVVGVAFLVVAGSATAAVTQSRPGSWTSARVDDFKTPDYTRLEERPTRFGGGLGSNRYDYWRVAVRAGGERPLTGVGVEGFAPVYLQERHSLTAPRYAHNLWLGTFAELGIPGLAMLAILSVALALAWITALRRAVARDRPLLVAAALPAVALTLHASADWSAAFCALTIPALAFLAAAGRPDPEAPRTVREGPAGRVLLVTGAAFALTALPLLGAARLEDRALAKARTDPGGAVADLRHAGRLDRIGPEPPLLEAVVLLEAGDRSAATRAFARAVDRDDGAWYPRFVLGILLAGSDRGAALRELVAAQRLNPRERLISRALEDVRAGGTPDAWTAQRQALSLPG